MNVTQRVKKLKETGPRHSQDRNLSEALRIFEDLRTKGMLRGPSYDIPPLDTIGKRLIQSSAKNKHVRA
jgi:hypothetical protein